MEIVAGQGAVSFNQIRRPMEDSSSQPFDHDQTAPGASKFLSDLPSRGHLYSTVISSNLSFAGGMRVYICEHILLLQVTVNFNLSWTFNMS
ncbi:hypothetical protein F383_11917 [Gossypium arboreum]|uniref:Uncharacterized protein n=1 Tax=Gossypium arboreum TaxID=29729 RepID=A0A0B0PUR6_GOSAR|nr:hypothetical protein F383_11917 [Gossypium arboreum]